MTDQIKAELTAEAQLTFTQRGFAVYDEFTDMRGSTVRVTESSNIEGGVWVWCTSEADPKVDDTPHLNDEQIDRLIAALHRAKARQYGDADHAADRARLDRLADAAQRVMITTNWGTRSDRDYLVDKAAIHGLRRALAASDRPVGTGPEGSGK